MRKRLAIAGAALALLVAAFVAGRYSAPVKVEERVKVETRTVTEWKDRVVEKKTQGPVRVVTRTVTKPGGEKVVDRVVDRGPVVTDRTQDGQGGSTTIAKGETIRIVETVRPSWRVGGSAGWSSLTPKPDLYGLELSRRVVGPLWLGIEARTDKTASVGLAVEW